MDIEHSFMPLLIAFAWMSGMLPAGTFLRAKAVPIHCSGTMLV
jgi:hypothetical protein